MVFISERITNISELETLIRTANINFKVLMNEMQKAAPSDELIAGTAKVVGESLEKAEFFEFCLEKRKCCFKNSCENPKVGENHADVDNRK